MSKEKAAEKEVKISPKEVERVKKALAEIKALKKALGWEEEEDSGKNPGIASRDLFLFMVRMENKHSDKLSALDGKLSWLLGASATAVALLIALAVAVF